MVPGSVGLSRRVEADDADDDVDAKWRVEVPGGWQRSIPIVFSRSKSTFRLAPLHGGDVTCIREKKIT